MEQVYYLGGAAAARILSMGTADHLVVWAWFLIAMVIAIHVLLWKRSQGRAKSVPVRSNAKARRPTRIAPRSPRR